MYNATAAVLVGPTVVLVEVSVTADVDKDQNITTTDSPTSSWQATACTGLNVTVDGGCLMEGNADDNASTSTVAALSQCAVFVQPWALLLLAFPLLTVFGNILVCLSVYRERNLRTATNFFIVSLAVADIMVAILVMPLAVYVEVGRCLNRV